MIVVLERFGDFGARYRNIRSDRSPSLFGVFVPNPGMFPDQLDRRAMRLVSVKTLRLSLIRDAITRATQEGETGALNQQQLELVLDYLFAELDRRLNK